MPFRKIIPNLLTFHSSSPNLPTFFSIFFFFCLLVLKPYKALYLYYYKYLFLWPKHLNPRITRLRKIIFPHPNPISSFRTLLLEEAKTSLVYCIVGYQFTTGLLRARVARNAKDERWYLLFLVW